MISEIGRNTIPLSPPASLNCREILPLLAPQYAKHARISRLFTDKPDCGERTARQRGRYSPGFSLEGTRAVRLGECNAITSRRFGHDELAFASTLETEVGNKQHGSVATNALLITNPTERRNNFRVARHPDEFGIRLPCDSSIRIAHGGRTLRDWTVA